MAEEQHSHQESLGSPSRSQRLDAESAKSREQTIHEQGMTQWTTLVGVGSQM